MQSIDDPIRAAANLAANARSAASRSRTPNVPALYPPAGIADSVSTPIFRNRAGTSFSDQPIAGGVQLTPGAGSDGYAKPASAASASQATPNALSIGAGIDGVPRSRPGPVTRAVNTASPDVLAGIGADVDYGRASVGIGDEQALAQDLPNITARARQAQDFAASTSSENAIAQRNQSTELARRARQAAGDLRLVPGGRTQRQLLAEAAGFDNAATEARGRIGTDKDFIRTPEQEQTIARGLVDDRIKQQDANARTLAAQAEAERAARGPQENFGNPVAEIDPDGRPVLAQYGSLGTRRTIDGAQPIPKPNSGVTVAADGTLQLTANAKGRQLPSSIQKLEDTDIENLNTAAGIRTDLGGFLKQIQDGSLKLGPVTNLENRARNFIGDASPESQNYASFRAALEKMRNDSLRLNKGVQTEGDAVRAWNELTPSLNDPKVVAQRLQEISGLNDRAAQFYDKRIQNRRQNYGMEPLDTREFYPSGSPYTKQQAEHPPDAPDYSHLWE